MEFQLSKPTIQGKSLVHGGRYWGGNQYQSFKQL